MNKEISEIYTVEYIAREACILIRIFSPHKKKRRFIHRDFTPNEMDKRILQRWGVYP